VALPPINGRATPQAANPQPVADPRAAAQRAFFNTALAKAGAAAAATPTAAPTRPETRAVQPAVTRLQNETEVPPHPGRILRPGSIIDIKV
jgi:hypothetical protein